MKSLSLIGAYVGLLVLLFIGGACERHPASETIPGYEGKKAEEQKNLELQKLDPAIKKPVFFHQEAASQ